MSSTSNKSFEKHQRRGNADSAVFPEWAAPVRSVANGAKRLGAPR
jgi:hypothetical protein